MSEIALDLVLLAISVIVVLVLLALCDAGMWLVALGLRLLSRLMPRPRSTRPTRVEVLDNAELLPTVKRVYPKGSE